MTCDTSVGRHLICLFFGYFVSGGCGVKALSTRPKGADCNGSSHQKYKCNITRNPINMQQKNTRNRLKQTNTERIILVRTCGGVVWVPLCFIRPQFNRKRHAGPEWNVAQIVPYYIGFVIIAGRLKTVSRCLIIYIVAMFHDLLCISAYVLCPPVPTFHVNTQHRHHGRGSRQWTTVFGPTRQMNEEWVAGVCMCVCDVCVKCVEAELFDGIWVLTARRPCRCSDVMCACDRI